MCIPFDLFLIVLWNVQRMCKNMPTNIVFLTAVLTSYCIMIRSKHSISLWYLYIAFEILQNNVTKAKTLFFRAIRECPWAKGSMQPWLELVAESKLNATYNFLL
jgi:hypothetical protein